MLLLRNFFSLSLSFYFLHILHIHYHYHCHYILPLSAPSTIINAHRHTLYLSPSIYLGFNTLILFALSKMLIVIDDSNAIFAYNKMAHAIRNKKSSFLTKLLESKLVAAQTKIYCYHRDLEPIKCYSLLASFVTHFSVSCFNIFSCRRRIPSCMTAICLDN